MLSENEPCVRNTMPDCSNLEKDTCYVAKPWCCPNKYYCQRSPVVGLYCQHSAVQCGNFEWCRDFADISGQCKTKVCQEDMLVERMTQYAFICSALGVLIDIIDLVTFCACPDAVIFKAVTNMCSSCIKWVAFGVIVGSGAKEFMQELIEARCYNNSGMEMVRCHRRLGRQGVHARIDRGAVLQQQRDGNGSDSKRRAPLLHHPPSCVSRVVVDPRAAECVFRRQVDWCAICEMK